MPCDSSRQPTEIERIRDILADLNRRLERGNVGIAIGAEGGIAFTGWTEQERGGMTDVCAYRRLTAENSFALRLAVQRAEAQSGRRVNQAAVAAGVHSHDGGRTFHPGH